jgi:hypothetical protein
MEGLIEHLAMLPPFHENGVKGPVKIIARPERSAADGIKRLKHKAGPDGQSRLPQHTGEVHDIDGKLAGWSGAILVGRNEVHDVYA